LAGIKWWIGIPPEVTTEYVGVKLGDYYRSPKLMLKTQLKAREILEKLYGIGRFVGIGPTYSAYVEASMLGVEVIFPEDNVPMVKGPVLKRIEDVDKLKMKDPYKEGLMAKVIKTYKYMKKEVGDIYHVGCGGTEGPITTAVIVRGPEFFVDVYRKPEKAHQLLEIVTNVSLRLREVIEEVTGETMRRTGIADDFAGYLTPKQYEEFVCPYYRRIYKRFGRDGRNLHSELLRKDHLQFLRQLKVSHYDPGMNPYLTVKDLVMSGIPFSWNLKTAQDMLMGTPESIKRKFKMAIEDGAREVATELCRGVPRENILAFVSTAKSYEDV